MICLDSSVLIEYYRKIKKEKSFLFQLAATYSFAIPAIVKYEIYRGGDSGLYWDKIFKSTPILPFDNGCAETAAKIYLDLRYRNKIIGTDDILIAATAINNNLKLGTLNKKDFERIEGLDILTPPL